MKKEMKTNHTAYVWMDGTDKVVIVVLVKSFITSDGLPDSYVCFSKTWTGVSKETATKDLQELFWKVIPAGHK